jgi:hypothetical protein
VKEKVGGLGKEGVRGDVFFYLILVLVDRVKEKVGGLGEGGGGRYDVFFYLDKNTYS